MSPEVSFWSVAGSRLWDQHVREATGGPLLTWGPCRSYSERDRVAAAAIPGSGSPSSCVITTSLAHAGSAVTWATPLATSLLASGPLCVCARRQHYCRCHGPWSPGCPSCSPQGAPQVLMPSHTSRSRIQVGQICNFVFNSRGSHFKTSPVDEIGARLSEFVCGLRVCQASGSLRPQGQGCLYITIVF